jgi:hypothetical protein
MAVGGPGVNRVRQRLIAAGASPTTATQYASNLAKKTQGNDADLEDIFDAELGELAKQQYPSIYRPPTPDDPDFDDYLEFVKGPAARQKLNAAIAKSTQNISAIYQDMFNKGYFEPDNATVKQDKFDLLTLPEYVVKRIYLDRDATALQLKNEIKKTTGIPAQAILDYQTTAADPDSFNELINTINTETNSGSEAVNKIRQNYYDNDKTWKSGVPDSKLKFGSSTNLKKGIVSYRTLPGVEDYFAEQNRIAKEQFPGSSAAAGIAVPLVEKNLIASGLTPFKFEGQTRQKLKGQRFK